ncbi:hypothetical protein HPC37_10605 [Pasteurellaceae bacterium 20609_3]|uniref:hypothetical protein n=1 Tax=Spirabiliibacterium mucosae TaxID=28156 RepID=UPI001AACA569|nr:hypothetical protein [Spirabiliibacterium mucosae]MBE2899198.1 hypothetical protein [Spirabiliibacterium mucosae]
MLWDSATRVGYPADKVNDFVERHVDDQDLKAYRRELRDFQIKIDAENAGMTKEEVKSFVEKHKNDEYLYSYLDEIDKIKFLTRAEDEGMTKEEAKAFYDKYNSDEDRMALNDAFNQYVIKKIAFNEALNHGMSEKKQQNF